MLLKPSEVPPLSAVEFVRGWAEIGAPPVLALATGYGDTGAAVIDNADFVITGSTATGRKVAVACAERLIPFSLELGGDPALVLADADLDRAANGNDRLGGISSVERVYVEAPVYEEFVEHQAHRDPPTSSRATTTSTMSPFDVGPLATATPSRESSSRHWAASVLLPKPEGAWIRTNRGGGRPAGQRLMGCRPRCGPGAR